MTANQKPSISSFSDRSDADPRGNQSVSVAREDLQTLDDIINFVRHKAHENPEKFALSCLGVGFILGWKLKPW